MTTNLTTRADALVEGLLKRTIHFHVRNGHLTIGKPSDLGLEVELSLCPWRARLVRSSWCHELDGYTHFGGSECDIRLSAPVAWKLHQLARRLRTQQRRVEAELARVEKEEERKQTLTRLARVLGRAEERLAKKAAGTPADAQTAECPQKP